MCGASSTNLVHEYLCPCVQPRGDTIVERILKLLLLPYDRVQKVGLVDVLSLIRRAEKRLGLRQGKVS